MPLILALTLLFQDEPGSRFFSKPDVDFWGTKKPEKSPPLFPETMPDPVRDLLDHPTKESAQKYLEWQKARMARLQEAVRALEEAKGGRTLLYFTRPGCPFCAEEEKVLAGLEGVRVVRVADPELWKKYTVTATPTLVLDEKGREPKIWRGYVTRARLEKEMKDADR